MMGGAAGEGGMSEQEKQLKTGQALFAKKMQQPTKQDGHFRTQWYGFNFF